MEDWMFILVAMAVGAVLVWLGYMVGWRGGYNRGERDSAEARYGYDMEKFWQRQDFLKEHGYPYMTRDRRMVIPNDRKKAK